MNYILWGMSWSNLLMLSATIPKYPKSKKDGDDIDDEDVEEISGSDLRGFLGI